VNEFVDQIVELVTYRAAMVGITDIGVFDNTNDEYIEEGVTYVIAKGAVRLDNSVLLQCIQEGNEPVHDHLVHVTIPELVYKIVDGVATCGDGSVITAQQ